MYTEKNLKKWTEGIKNTHTHSEGQNIKYGNGIQAILEQWSQTLH